MKHWPTKPLGDLVLPTEQRDPRENPSEEFSYVDIAGVDNEAKTITTVKKIVGADAPSRARKVIRKGDVIVSTVRPNLNAVAFVPDSLDNQICSTGFSVLRPSEKVLSGYLFAFARSQFFIDTLVAKTTGANYPAVNDGEVKDVLVPVPPVAEQERIVKLLDEADELRKLRAQADHRTAALNPALFHEMFGNVVSNDMNWPTVLFAEIGEARLGKMLDAKQQTGKHNRQYIRNANVQWDRLQLDDLLEMDFNETNREEFRLRYGDLLICEGGEVGRAAIWRDELAECYFQKALHRVRLHPSKATPEFVVHLLRAIATDNGFRDCVGSATIPHLTGVKLASIRIPLPPLPLQQAFAGRVEEIRALQSGQAASRRRLEDLFQSSLHRAFQGEL